jgi:hypothetical protein
VDVPKKRGAVVIGVNKTGDLQPLEASAEGAAKFGVWLEGEGFEVVTITDKAGAVTASQIKEAIKHFVLPGTYDQLLLYFTGHGYWKNDAELWLLTNAPGDADEAVNWKETIEFAKDCGIPNVVLISDACRSIPTTPRAMRVRGSIVFPNDDVKRERSKVDKFLAAATGTFAYEIPIALGGKKENAFTYCLMQAFQRPDKGMVLDIKEDGRAVRIVPNRRLGPFLKREVPALLAKVNITMDQAPDEEVLSDDSAYIGHTTFAGEEIITHARDKRLTPKRVRGGTRGEKRRPMMARAPDDLKTIASKALVDALNVTDVAQHLGQLPIPSFEATGNPKFDQAIHTARELAAGVRHFETTTGFAILGARTVRAVLTNGQSPDVLSPGDGIGEPAVIRVSETLPSGTVVVQFDNGNGAPLAALRGYIGHVVVHEGSVASVSYIPSENSNRFHAYQNRGANLLRLRAAAAAAMKFGVFRIAGQDSALKLAEQIRVEKSIDPSLGLYAAYAYSEADDQDELTSVAMYMHGDLSVDLFDVAMLAKRSINIRTPEGMSHAPTVPVCPMLTQGWNLLRARRIKLPEVLDEAQDELVRAVWTTFNPERTQAIFKLVEEGGLR